MKKNIINVVVLLLILVAAIYLGTRSTRQVDISPDEIQSLISGFVDFAKEQVEKNPKRKVLEVNIKDINKKSGGQVRLSYDLTYEEDAGEEVVTYGLGAWAILKYLGKNEWELVSVKNDTQALDFAEGLVIKADKPGGN